MGFDGFLNRLISIVENITKEDIIFGISMLLILFLGYLNVIFGKSIKEQDDKKAEYEESVHKRKMEELKFRHKTHKEQMDKAEKRHDDEIKRLEKQHENELKRIEKLHKSEVKQLEKIIESLSNK